MWVGWKAHIMLQGGIGMEDKYMKQLEDHEHRIKTLEIRDEHLQNRLDANDNKLDRIENKIDLNSEKQLSIMQQYMTHKQTMESETISHKHSIQLKVMGWIASIGIAAWAIIQAVTKL